MEPGGTQVHRRAAEVRGGEGRLLSVHRLLGRLVVRHQLLWPLLVGRGLLRPRVLGRC